mmetsp:Transcript_23364/g.22989  ORF Transcript_23364/g.22989 Transcript_23364/m.22989 type:complete len:308 (-) Transcript_23364:42-965(-)|eukprot:CAMPEP_0170555940 /NCGR_PEP_ID=MMETSP0211-20121228/14761_1 /TAXON_ID=311385 /ORGANISM="Pseudokeronopsis sp., Strain OXSARD2" /LENGTH=307 /DNA_ID=CAMNT_0010865979 /DNA_START=14 /DNA_END=937 /DNA_ORIENTATION=+
MYKLVLIGLLASASFAEERVLREEMVEYLKTHAKTWTPMEVSENPLNRFSKPELLGLLGTIANQDSDSLAIFESDLTSTPSTFDGRDEFGDCVHPIRDQASCGSCWAFGASEVLSDRLCIESDGSLDIVLSPQDMVSCDGRNYGCSGGYLSRAFSYLESDGIVSEACYPYTSGKFGISGSCASSCTGKGSFTKYYCAKGSSSKAYGIDAIKKQLMDGPVEVDFDVYEDFYYYKEGIYSQTSTNYQGGHAVKFVGWGAEGSVNYWIVANSWGEGWGEKGFFRIKHGECGIDDIGYACTADVNSGVFFE